MNEAWESFVESSSMLFRSVQNSIKYTRILISKDRHVDDDHIDDPRFTIEPSAGQGELVAVEEEIVLLPSALTV